MLANISLEMWDFSPKAIFDMFENEIMTANHKILFI